MEEKSVEYQQRLTKLEDLRKSGVNPYPNDFKPSAECAQVLKDFGELTKEDLEAKNISLSIAGRIMAIRDFGKASFIQVKDRAGRLQAYIKKEIVGEEAYSLFKAMDMGDIIGLEGALFRTRTNELTVVPI